MPRVGLLGHCCCCHQLLSCVQLFVTPWTAWNFLSFTISWSLLKFMPIESVMLSKHLIFCCPLILVLLIFPSIRIFSNKLPLHIRRPKYWSFSFSISPFNEYSGLISLGLTGLISLLSKGLKKFFWGFSIRSCRKPPTNYLANPIKKNTQWRSFSGRYLGQVHYLHLSQWRLLPQKRKLGKQLLKGTLSWPGSCLPTRHPGLYWAT